MSLAGQTVVITGVSSGIGRALALAAARQGARVAAIARRQELLASLAEQARSFGGVIAPAVADVTDRHAILQAIDNIQTNLGPADLLIANAGIARTTGAVHMNVPAVEEILRVNVLGCVYAIEAVLPGMISRGRGHIVGISSLAAFKGLPGSAAYCASKAALNTYLEALRIELRSRGVAVTAVCPGFIRTAMTSRNPRMPLVLEAEAAAERILRALGRRPAVYRFPWAMSLLMRLTAWVPDGWIAGRVPIAADDAAES